MPPTFYLAVLWKGESEVASSVRNYDPGGGVILLFLCVFPLSAFQVHGPLWGCLEWCPPPAKLVEVLTPSTGDCDLIWKTKVFAEVIKLRTLI